MVTRTLMLMLMVVGIVLAQEPQQQEMNLNDYLALAKEDLAVQSKKLMLINMQLTEEEGKKYWPIYDEYFAEAFALYQSQPETLRALRSHVYTYFSTTYPTTP